MLCHRRSTLLLSAGLHNAKVILYAPPDRTMSLLDKAGSYTALDISPDGRMVITGALSELRLVVLVYDEGVQSVVLQGEPST